MITMRETERYRSSSCGGSAKRKYVHVVVEIFPQRYGSSSRRVIVAPPPIGPDPSRPDLEKQPQKGNPMNSNILRATTLAAALLGTSPLPAFAADPTGTWLTEEGKATVRVADCGGVLCGKIVSLKEPNDPQSGKPKIDKNNADADKRSRAIIGVQILIGLKPDGANKWSGQVYNPEDGKTYAASVTLPNASTIKVQGCLLGGVICKTSTWTRGSL
jgi:uncharacterized protein (DUF2147 family)